VTRAKAAGLSAAFLISGFGLTAGITGLLFPRVWPGGPPDVASAALLQSAVMLAVFGLATWVFGIRAAGLDATSLRWHGGLRDAMQGLALGVGPAAVALAVAVPLAGALWTRDGAPWSAWLATLPRFAAIIIPAAFVEELTFRGVPMVLLSRAFGRGAAITGLAVLFAAAHLFNPAVSPLALVNVALAGIWLGTVFYWRGGLWTATGAHVGWNLAIAVLAAPVSGLDFTVPWLDYRPGGPSWLSGGAFGPEGGLIATGVLILATVMAARFTERPKESYA